jgi:hypothetical protein
MIKIEHDTATNIITEIELSAAEIKEIEKLQKEAVEKNLLMQTETESKAAQRQAILDKLGLTADEAQLLIG